ncbi:MAG: SDR family NAD(P)-dependent oxidoreductase, partial [Bacteroidetes bacterium]|nr:SDR family NAD(P)-dependent oxidoreductase [Bacteroidota bacterium]
MMKKKQKIALITGATSGIGLETSRLLAENGYNLIITGRRNERLDELAEEIINRQRVHVTTLAFSVSKRNDTVAAIKSLPAAWKKIDVLINNAGYALGLNPVDEGDPDDWDSMIDTNIRGVLNMTYAVIPLMKARGNGHIINVSSIAGKENYPKD